MTRVTMEQKRAQDAWEKAERYNEEHTKFAKGLPALIMNSGLMQVMAFCEEKGTKASQRHVGEVARDLRQWLHQTCDTPEDFDGFMEAMMQADSRKFQAVTTEAFAWLRWLRQMAAARQGARQ